MGSETVAVPLSVLREAIWAIDWCVSEHYAPDSSREQAALKGLRKALAAHPTPGDSPCKSEQVRALELALRLVGEYADDAMHVRRVSRDVLEEIEANERTLKAMLAEATPKDPHPCK